MLMTVRDNILIDVAVSENGRSREYEKGWADQLILHIKARNFAGNNPTITVQLQSSPDKVVWDNIEASIILSADGQNTIRSINFGRYVRANWTLGGTNPVISNVDIIMQTKG